MCLLCGVCAEAMAFYQWMAHAEPPPDRPPLFNMDETALVRHVTGLRGCVAKASQTASVAVDRATLADRCSCMSYLACVSDCVRPLATGHPWKPASAECRPDAVDGPSFKRCCVAPAVGVELARDNEKVVVPLVKVPWRACEEEICDSSS